jgi:tRNA (cmo5U34)-methyltransferase
MTTQTIKEHFEEEAAEFDYTIVKLIPYYNQMIRALIDAVHFKPNDTIRIIDLGCGTGTLAKQIADRFPNSKIVCLDIASKMIELARHKLSDYKNIEYVVGDFSEIDFHEQFDVVVSSLALHHIPTDNGKIEFYTKIYNVLTDNGQFINADVVLASTEYQHNIDLTRWIEFMQKSISLEEITTKWIPTHKNEDRPSKLIDQLKWLEVIGFKTVDVIWKYYDFSVYGGIK